MGNRTLTAVTGIAVGHADDPVAATGCTVVIGPFAAAAHVHGFATGSRELDALSPFHLVPQCDALLLTGGSAFGLAAADGVVRWLEERGRGFATRAARVPIVPAAVLYDLAVGRADVRPDAAMGYAAATAASSAPVGEGRRGAGAGATVGKILGMDRAAPGGIGSWADPGDPTVAALVAVNAFGDVVAADGRILAGPLTSEGRHLDTAAALREGVRPQGFEPGPGEHTTLAVVATDAGLSRRELGIVARQAAAAIPRRISPSGTLFDGDLVVALATGERNEPCDPFALTQIALRAQLALETAIERAVAAEATA